MGDIFKYELKYLILTWWKLHIPSKLVMCAGFLLFFTLLTLLSPSTLFFCFSFFVHLIVFCTSCCFLHTLLFFAHLVVFCTSCCLLHILLFFAHLIVFCTSYCFALFIFIAHFTLISHFLTICMPLCYVTLCNLYSYYFALSTERTWFDYISRLIIPCITIMWQIKKPWPWPWFIYFLFHIDFLLKRCVTVWQGVRKKFS